jgi:predicted small lipoprotein YifL
MRLVVQLMAGLLTVAAVLAACGGEIDHPTSAPTAAPETARTEAQDRDFVLVLESASERWLASEDIEVSATLTYVGEGTGTDTTGPPDRDRLPSGCARSAEHARWAP